jgi:hypothetical protein
MSLILDGTNGLSDIDGTAATPAIRGTDANTGIFFPAADTIAFSEGGAEVARFDSSGNLLVGSTTYLLSGMNAGQAIQLGARTFIGTTTGGDTSLGGLSGSNLTSFLVNGSERGRFDASGNLLVGKTALPSASVFGFAVNNSSNNFPYLMNSVNTTGTGTHFEFYNPNGKVGSITTNGSATSYVTSSDYRLKENVAPMTGALATVAALKPVTYTWKADGSAGQGFIAHELQAVVPDCVTGEKDAVSTDGSPMYQGVDTSFLVATLVAAIQELKAEVDALKEVK